MIRLLAKKNVAIQPEIIDKQLVFAILPVVSVWIIYHGYVFTALLASTTQIRGDCRIC